MIIHSSSSEDPSFDETEMRELKSESKQIYPSGAFIFSEMKKTSYTRIQGMRYLYCSPNG